MSERTTHTGLIAVGLTCRSCGWEYEGANAQGLAAQHADKTGHEVRVELHRLVVYNRATPESPEPQP